MDNRALENKLCCFIYNLRRLRANGGISKKDMAKILDIKLSDWNLIEMDIVPPNLALNALLRVCDYFCVSADELLMRKLDK